MKSVASAPRASTVSPGMRVGLNCARASHIAADPVFPSRSAVTTIRSGTTPSGPDSDGTDLIKKGAAAGLANDGWVVMPGGFVRIADDLDARAITLQQGGRTGDACSPRKHPPGVEDPRCIRLVRVPPLKEAPRRIQDV